MRKVPTSNQQKFYSQKVREMKERTVSYDYKWREFSKEYRIENPFCVECLKLGNYNCQDIHVDHIIPLEQRPDLKYDHDNCQSLCRSCHGKKTHKEKLEKPTEH